jgi:hypothetical protein
MDIGLCDERDWNMHNVPLAAPRPKISVLLAQMFPCTAALCHPFIDRIAGR